MSEEKPRGAKAVELQELLEMLSNVGVVELQDVVIRAKKLVIKPRGRGEHGGR